MKCHIVTAEDFALYVKPPTTPTPSGEVSGSSKDEATTCLGTKASTPADARSDSDALVTFGDSYTDIVSYLWQVWSVV